MGFCEGEAGRNAGEHLGLRVQNQQSRTRLDQNNIVRLCISLTPEIALGKGRLPFMMPGTTCCGLRNPHLRGLRDAEQH